MIALPCPVAMCIGTVLFPKPSLGECPFRCTHTKTSASEACGEDEDWNRHCAGVGATKQGGATIASVLVGLHNPIVCLP